MTDEQLILVAGGLLAAGIGAALLAGRLRVPGLILFLVLGMAIGTDGAGWIQFDNYDMARTIGVVALVVILFEGGLTAGWPEIRPVLRPAATLAVAGTLITALVTGLSATLLFGISTLEGLLLGSIVASTDVAAIFALLRGSTLNRKLARTLEGEAGSNDPVAVLLVVGFIAWIGDPSYGLGDMLWLFFRQLTIGLAVGALLGWLSVWAFRRVRLESAGLYPVASIAAAALAYGLAATATGSGFLAVYVVGLWLGSSQIPAKRTIAAFHEGVAWVAQIVLFLTLGLLVFPSQLGDVLIPGTLLALILMFVARPLATVVCTAGRGYTTPERVVLGWAGLRGAVPVVLATFPVIAGVAGSLEFFNIVFFAVVLSTLLQGATFEPLARALGVTTTQPALPRPLAETGTVRGLGAEVVEYPVAADDAVVGRRIRELGLPRDALVNVIVRDGQALPPRGSTRIQAGDSLHVLLRQEAARDFDALLAQWRDGTWPEPESRQPTLRSTSMIFTVRPWRPSDGDPARPAKSRAFRWWTF